MVRLFLALFGALFILVFLEVLLRLADYPRSVWRPPPPSVINPYDSNPYLLKGRPFLHTYRSGSVYTMKFDVYEVTYHINSRGFRGPEPALRPPKGKKRLLVLGDSMVEGHGVEFDETFSALLNGSEALEGWETVNVGIQGASATYYCANLPRYLALHPDAILLVLYDNDLRDDYGLNFDYRDLDFFRDAERVLVRGRAPEPAGSRLLGLAERAFRFDGGENPAHWEGGEAVEAVNRRHLAENKIFRPTFEFPKDEYIVSESDWPEVWSLTVDYLSLFHEALSEREIPLLLAHLSLQYSMPQSSPERRRHARMFRESAEDWAGERRVPFLSCESALRSELEVPGRPRILFPADGHLNPVGHRLAAEILEPWLAGSLPARTGEKEGENAASH